MVEAARILHQQVAAVCPISGVAVGQISNRATWRADFDPAASPAQRSAAANVLATFDLAAAVATEAARENGIDGDADLADLINRLRAATADQIKNYVQNNVTDLPSAKILFAKILLILARTI